jgi:hypothetical protein
MAMELFKKLTIREKDKKSAYTQPGAIKKPLIRGAIQFSGYNTNLHQSDKTYSFS